MFWLICKYYKESFWANVVECIALLCPIMAAAICIFVLDIESLGFLIIAAAFAGTFLLKRAAAKVNTYTMEKKIAENASYAKYIAETYPDMKLRCLELNAEYAIYGYSIPFVDFHPKRQRNSMIIQIVGLGILFTIMAVFIIWLVYLHNTYGI